jgi:hypothetical protein
MNAGARTPEELETLFEDAFVVGDRANASQRKDSADEYGDDTGRGRDQGRRKRRGRGALVVWRVAVIKATASDTGGRMTIVEMTEPPGHPAPLHDRPRRLSDAVHPHPGGVRERGARDERPAGSRALPPASEEEPDFEHVARVARDNGCELLA